MLRYQVVHLTTNDHLNGTYKQMDSDYYKNSQIYSIYEMSRELCLKIVPLFALAILNGSICT